MAHSDLIVEKQRLTHEGLFSVFEFYRLICDFFEEKGYDKMERLNVEADVRANPEFMRGEFKGKYYEWHMTPWKKITDYAKSSIDMKVYLTDVTEVMVEKNGVKVKMQKGKIHIVFDAECITDYEDRWDGTPFFFFIGTLFNKYFFSRYIRDNHFEVKTDFDQLVYQIKTYLNMRSA